MESYVLNDVEYDFKPLEIFVPEAIIARAGENLRETNDIMSNCSGWVAFSNPRYFPEPYRRQRGWEKPDNKMADFQPLTEEQMEELSLPEEWMK